MNNIDDVLNRMERLLTARDCRMSHPDYDLERIDEDVDLTYGDLRALVTELRRLEQGLM